MVFILFSTFFARIIIKIFNIRLEKGTKKSKVYKSSRFVFCILGVYISLRILNLPTQFMDIVNKIFKLILIFEITKIVANIIDNNSKIFNKLKENEDIKNENTIKIIIKAIRCVIYVIGVFIFIAELGYDLSGLVTGLGIGSVVIALAAQDLAKSILGGLSILLDKTFVIGDSIEVKGIFGTVEDITFRTTRIRKVDNSIIVMPNSVLVDSDIINWNKLQKRRYETKLRLSLDTTPEKVNNLCNIMQKELENMPNIINDTLRVYFSEIQQDCLLLMVYLYTSITDYDEYIKFINNLNLKILSILDKEKVKLIYPAQDINILR